ncbi:prolyl 4-hydroxylase subunit alpha-2-like [Folsomia candida]|uniref:prolyl 4-hydroxylase subunit alpha-2-like n=1 Tax=Folsomia candida TaxID=158441 RepID=UPI00160547A7|nr:prolyl 4-hydroxylase subunit alpha-2-like [Folsomia candida]
MEILSESPEIIIFHDVVKGELINKIWDAAVVPLEEDAQQPESKSLIGDLCSPEGLRLICVGLCALIFIYIHSVVNGESMGKSYARLYSTLELVTGLNFRQADFLRLTQYFISASAGVHHDSHNVLVSGTSITFGDRLATVIIYMNDVLFGGETVFPNLNLMVKPVKGSVIYW